MASPDMVWASRQFFEDPGSYAPFTQMLDGRVIAGCIDPRDVALPHPGAYHVSRQSPGGEVGDVLDDALARTAAEGDFHAVQDRFGEDTRFATDTLRTAHYRCKFDAAADVVTDEVVNPSDLTVENTERWSRQMGYGDLVSAKLPDIIEAAKQQVEHLRETQPMGGLAEHAEETVHVRGENFARVYTVNLHPDRGMNPNAKPRNAQGVSVAQGYHDSLAANVAALRDERSLPADVRGLRLAAMVCRSAATQTVITAGKLPEMTLYEVYPDSDAPNSLAVVERKVD